MYVKKTVWDVAPKTFTHLSHLRYCDVTIKVTWLNVLKYDLVTAQETFSFYFFNIKDVQEK